VDTVIAVANPAGTGPDIAIPIGTDTIGKSALRDNFSVFVFHIQHHGSEFTAILQIRLFLNIPDLDVTGCIVVVAGTGVGHVEHLVVR